MYQHLQNIIIKTYLSDFQTVLRCNVGVISEECLPPTDHDTSGPIKSDQIPLTGDRFTIFP